MLKFLGGLALAATAILVGGFAVSTMWGWFIVPLGAPAMSLAHGYGLSLFVTLFTQPLLIQSRVKDDPAFTANMKVALSVVMNGILLLVGLVTVQFI